MKNVVLVTGSWPPMECGVGYYSANLLRELDGVAVKATLVTTANTQQVISPKEVLQPRSWLIRDVFSVYSMCKRANPDLIHIQYPARGYGRRLGINLLPWLIRVFARRSRLVVTLHEYFGSPLIGRIRDLITVLPAHAVVVSNEADRRHLPWVIRRKSSIIPLGPTIESASPDYDAANELAGVSKRFDSNNILYYGFAFPSKHLEDLVAAMEFIPNKDLLMSTNLRQSNPYENSLLKQVHTHNTRVGREQIRVLGFQNNDVLVALLQSCFCFVLPQHIPVNTKSSTVVAALRNGIPLIGKAGESWENYPLQNEVNSLLINEVNPGNIAAAVNSLVTSRDLYDSIVGHISEVSRSYYWQSIAQKHLELYESIGSPKKGA